MSGLKDCKHKSGDRCAVADAIYGGACARSDDHCAACQRSKLPMAINKVTTDMAAGPLLVAGFVDQAREIHERYEEERDADAVPRGERLRAILAGVGPGSQLWKLLGTAGIKHDSSCPCLTHAERMNAWGVAGCRAAAAEIVGWLEAEAGRRGWAWLFSRWGARQLVLLACRRSEKAGCV